MREVSWQALEYNVEYYIQVRVKQVIEDEDEDDDLLITEKLSGMAIGTYNRTAQVLGRTSCVFTNVRAIEGAKLPSGIGNRQLEWFADIKQYKFYYPEKDDIVNRSAIRSLAQYPPTRSLPQSIIELTKSYIKKTNSLEDSSSVSMHVNKDRSYNDTFDSIHKKYPDHYDEEYNSPDGSNVSMEGNTDRSFNDANDSIHTNYPDHYDEEDKAGTKKNKKHLKNKTLKRNKGTLHNKNNKKKNNKNNKNKNK
jgi:hypothetical protein